MAGYLASLVHNRFEQPIEFICDEPFVLTIENPNEFYATVNELQAVCNGGEGDFVLYNGDERIPIAKHCEMITDVFSMDLGERKVLSILYKELVDLAKDDELSVLQNEINTKLAMFYGALFDKMSLPLSYDEFDLSLMLKTSNVHIDEPYDSFLESLVCFLNASVMLKRKTLFVFVNLKSVLSDKDLLMLYKHCALEKIGLLLIEGRADRGKISDERHYVVTDDLCAIVDSDTDL